MNPHLGPHLLTIFLKTNGKQRSFTFLFFLVFIFPMMSLETIPQSHADCQIIINDIYVSDDRVNVVEVTYVGFQLIWSNDNSPVQVVQVYISGLPGMYYRGF